ncbi:hypothetical protein CTKZ_28720 [Cellulomonas algicola]|uniref:Uncharacterized protein n=1 Tax=Cellulomonas algicola TaxID=2071633 RepID=A0A401V321_9CELL|nr:hypothetical protein CTKZ_28720 [Cellulomonas algicola]
MVLLGVELVDLLRAPRLVQVLQRVGGRRARVVPALERGEHDGLVVREVRGCVLTHLLSLGRVIPTTPTGRAAERAAGGP